MDTESSMKSVLELEPETESDTVLNDILSGERIFSSLLSQTRVDVSTIESDSFLIFDRKEDFEQAFFFLTSEDALQIDLSKVDFDTYSILVVEVRECASYWLTFTEVIKREKGFLFLYNAGNAADSLEPVVTVLMIKKSDLPQEEFTCEINAFSIVVDNNTIE